MLFYRYIFLHTNPGSGHEHAVPTSSEQACRVGWASRAGGVLRFYREGIEIGVVVIRIDTFMALEESDYPISQGC